MLLTSTVRCLLIWVAAGIILFAAPAPASATIKGFTIYHYSGRCGSVPFNNALTNFWEGRDRIKIASGERIRVTLYGDGADFAQDATGSRIHEWISDRGTVPSGRIMFGQEVPMGYVTVDIRAKSSHGLGNRTVTVKWPIGNEKLKLKIVRNCSELEGAAYRSSPSGSSGVSTPSGGVSHQVRIPNLLPSLLNNPIFLTRPLNQQVVATPGGGMMQVSDFFCDRLAASVVTAVPVPRLTWGVAGVNIELANSQFDVQLIDMTNPNAPRVLDTLSLAQGFPANTPLVHRDNYPGRPTSIRVVRNPSFPFGSGTLTFTGCFTEPGSTQSLDPMSLLLRVDPNNRINEGERENDNDYRF
jgi:hypothetical protein